MRFLKRHPEILFVIGIILLAGIAGNEDFKDAQLQERAYCANVADGTWPDYDANYDQICEDGKPINQP